uniref:E3 ubiquitin-protein ligase RMA n=1 Tax=Leersia perrieri TaxID=77586 RepID=A0A0D9WHJ9_9ORYZ
MAADDAARRSRRMDLNLYLGLPRAPRLRRPDLVGSDLALGTPMLSSSSPSSSAASADAPPMEAEMLLHHHHPPYSPSRAELVRPPTPLPEPYDPSAPEAHPPYVPPPVPAPEAIPELADDLDFGFSHPPPIPLRPSELIGWVDRPSSSTASSSFRPERVEQRYHPVICLNGRQSRCLRPRRFRSDLPPLGSEAPALENDAAAQPSQEPMRDAVEENKVVADGAIVAASAEEPAERGKSVAMFECNICFEMASEPVVTSCGHLFCWPCLYQWLHVHSTHKECPVCKGEVTEGNITPIYGRGNANSDAEKKVAEDGNVSGPAIPPRPHGNRLESFRQKFHHLRPISRRLGEAHGILSSWRRILDQQIMNSVSRFEGPPESTVQEMIDHAQHATRLGRITTRMRARRLQREAENSAFVASAAESGLPGNSTPDLPRRSSSPFSSERMDLLQHFVDLASTERLATAVSDLRRIVRPSPYGASTSSNPPNPELSVDGNHVAVTLAADQASNSSTMAVIQEDAAFTESTGEPSNAGSSRSLRRRGRNDTLGSLDVDGGGLHRNKRRRLN